MLYNDGNEGISIILLLFYFIRILALTSVSVMRQLPWASVLFLGLQSTFMTSRGLADDPYLTMRFQWTMIQSTLTVIQ